MPLINGCKYSCEPCIRGHRATSCAHTDRILIEVRKPGRPLESCGHEFATCTCGKITDLLSMGTVLPSPASDQAGQSPNATPFVTSPPIASATAKPKDRTRSHHRVSKKSKRRKGESSPKSPSTNRGSREPSTMLEEPGPSMAPNQPSYAYQDQTYSGGNSIPGPRQPSYVHYPSPPYQTMQSPIPGPQTFGSYQAGQPFNSQDAYQMTYSQQPQADYSVDLSSRIEDIARGPNTQQDNTDPNQPYIRSQYIMAKQDSLWRATR